MSCAEAIQQFADLDKEGSGQLHKDTLGKVLRKVDPHFKYEQYENMLAQVGQTKDGMVEYTQFLRWVFIDDEVPTTPCAWMVHGQFFCANVAPQGQEPDLKELPSHVDQHAVLIKKGPENWLPDLSLFVIAKIGRDGREVEMARKLYALGLQHIPPVAWTSLPGPGEAAMQPRHIGADAVTLRPPTAEVEGVEYQCGGPGKGDYLVVQIGYHLKNPQRSGGSKAHYLGDGFFWRATENFLGAGIYVAMRHLA